MQGTEEFIMAEIKINELNEMPEEEVKMTEEDMEHVKGGIGLLLPAVQKVRSASIKDGLSNTIVMGDGSV